MRPQGLGSGVRARFGCARWIIFLSSDLGGSGGGSITEARPAAVSVWAMGSREVPGVPSGVPLSADPHGVPSCKILMGYIWGTSGVPFSGLGDPHTGYLPPSWGYPLRSSHGELPAGRMVGRVLSSLCILSLLSIHRVSSGVRLFPPFWSTTRCGMLSCLPEVRHGVDRQSDDNNVFWWLMSLLLLIHGAVLISSLIVYLTQQGMRIFPPF